MQIREHILNCPNTGLSLSELNEAANNGDEEAKASLESIEKLGNLLAEWAHNQEQKSRNILDKLEATSRKIKDCVDRTMIKSERLSKSIDWSKTVATSQIDWSKAFKIPACLEQLYSVNKLTTSQIASVFDGVSKSTISYWLKKHDIETRRTGGNANFEDLTGDKFGRLTALSVDSTDSQGAKWKCQCDCGKTKVVSRKSLIGNRTRSCGCLKRESMFKGHGDLSLSYWGRIIKGAEKRELPVDVSISDAWEKFVEQEGRCAMSGMDISIVSDYTHKHHEHTASLDRIDPELGYIKGNIQWVHRDINMMRRAMGVERFVELCRKVKEHHDRIRTSE